MSFANNGYILSDPALSPITSSLCMGSYAIAVGECGKPCRNSERRRRKAIIRTIIPSIKCFYSSNNINLKT